MGLTHSSVLLCLSRFQHVMGLTHTDSQILSLHYMSQNTRKEARQPQGSHLCQFLTICLAFLPQEMSQTTCKSTTAPGFPLRLLLTRSVSRLLCPAGPVVALAVTTATPAVAASVAPLLQPLTTTRLTPKQAVASWQAMVA